MTRSAILVAACLIVSAGTARAQRLPASVIPEHYGIALSPSFQTDTFQGEESIGVRLLEPTSTVTLNAAEIKFSEVTITAGTNTQRATVALNASQETATFTVTRPLPAGPATIHITFVGQLNDKLRGFYLSKANGRKYAVTQLEPTDARRAFPCFDDPALKATFALTVTADKGDSVISNGRVLSDTPGPGEGRHTVKFSETPRMSSYLVAIAVGDFECLEGGADDIPIRICATPDKKALGAFALEAAEQIMSFYNRYYAIKYPFTKLDVVAVPDFAAGAMENTAAIFYRESDLLADSKLATLPQRKVIGSILAHEMAHMWFGDLVTMDWWDDIWLNEGFATWMQTKPLIAWKPDWHFEMEEATDTQLALRIDALQSTRPIHSGVETTDQINEVFDAIAYQKGSAVLRMVESYVGADIFRTGVNAYISKHAYGNATSDKFWAEIATASGKPVDRIMPTFVERPGLPLVSVETRCNGGRTGVTLSQQQYFSDPEAMATDQSTSTWQVPICLKRPAGDGKTATQCELLTARQRIFTLPGCAPWVFANAGAEGYYRSAYTADMLRRITGVVQSALTAPERVSLLGDEWELARVGKHSIDAYLTLASGLVHETQSEVMQVLTGRLAYLSDYLVSDADRLRFESWVRRLLQPAAADLGWTPRPDESDSRRQLRAIVLQALGVSGRDPEVLQKARTLIEEYMSNPDSVDPALGRVLINIAATGGDAALYEKFLAKSKAATVPTVIYAYFYALADFRDPALIAQSIDYATSDALRSQDAPYFIARLLTNKASRPAAWSAVKTRWTALEQRFGVFQGIPAIVRATSAFCDPADRDDVRRFFQEHEVPSAARTFKQSLETIDNCIGLKARQGGNLAGWIGRQAF